MTVRHYVQLSSKESVEKIGNPGSYCRSFLEVSKTTHYLFIQHGNYKGNWVKNLDSGISCIEFELELEYGN